MNHLSTSDLNSDSGIVSTPSPVIILLNEETNSNKLMNDASESGYATRDNFGLRSPVNVNDTESNSDLEFLFDEHTRFSFGPNNANESTTDMDTSDVAFCRADFGKYMFCKKIFIYGIVVKLPHLLYMFGVSST